MGWWKTINLEIHGGVYIYLHENPWFPPYKINQINRGLGPIPQPQWFGTLLQDLMLPTDSKLRDWDVVGTLERFQWGLPFVREKWNKLEVRCGTTSHGKQNMKKNHGHLLRMQLVGCNQRSNNRAALDNLYIYTMQVNFVADSCCVGQDITISPANLDFGQASATRWWISRFSRSVSQSDEWQESVGLVYSSLWW